MNLKEQKKDEKLKNLIKNKKYNEIYLEYGKKTYHKYASKKHKKQDIINLFKDGRYEDIHTKYGDVIYDNLTLKMMKNEILLENKNKYKADLYNIKIKIKKTTISVSLVMGGLVPILSSYFDFEKHKLYKDNEKEYSKELDIYNQRVEEYAENISKMNLSDLEIFMKVMDDMWNDIEGYGEPNLDVPFFWRLDFQETNGVGVCRNMADDVSSKLNAINPYYNARVVHVYLEHCPRDYADINREIISSGSENENSTSDSSLKNIVGNHAVVAVDIKDKGITLILDPTNPSISILRDGEIYTFGSEDGKGLKYKPIGDYALGFEILNNSLPILSTKFMNSDYSIEELENMYGIEAENEALKKVRNDNFKIPESINLNSENTKRVDALNELKNSITNENIEEKNIYKK